MLQLRYASVELRSTAEDPNTLLAFFCIMLCHVLTMLPISGSCITRDSNARAFQHTHSSSKDLQLGP